MTWVGVRTHLKKCVEVRVPRDLRVALNMAPVSCRFGSLRHAPDCDPRGCVGVKKNRVNLASYLSARCRVLYKLMSCVHICIYS